MDPQTKLNISAKAGKAIRWTSVSQFGRQAMQLLTTVILARLLSPSDFGLVGMAIVVTGFVGIFNNLGTAAAVVQRKDLSQRFLSSIYWVNIAFGLIAAVILYIISPLAADFYQEPRVTSILKVLSFNFFISAFSILPQALLEKELRFNQLAKVEMIATAISSIVGVGMAVFGFGVWSLVFQSIALVSTTTILLLTFVSWKPDTIFHWEEVRSVQSYSLNLTGFNIFNYFTRNIDNILIGRFLGAQDLGYYSLAYRIIFLPITTFYSIIGRVMFPIYSKLQDDVANFRTAFLKVAGGISMVTFPMMVGLWVLAEPTVSILFGIQWKPVILLIMIMAPAGMIQSVGTTVGAIYQAKGRTDWMLRWGVGAGSFIILSIVIGLHWGIIGVAAGFTIAAVILTYPNFAIPFKLINLPMRDLVKAIWYPLFCSGLMGLLIYVFKNLIPFDPGNPIVFGMWILFGILFYIAINWLINRDQVRPVLNIITAKV